VPAVWKLISNGTKSSLPPSSCKPPVDGRFTSITVSVGRVCDGTKVTIVLPAWLCPRKICPVIVAPVSLRVTFTLLDVTVDEMSASSKKSDMIVLGSIPVDMSGGIVCTTLGGVVSSGSVTPFVVLHSIMKRENNVTRKITTNNILVLDFIFSYSL
jgi:hypothetical protein